MRTFSEFLEATFLYPNMDKVDTTKISKLSDFIADPIDPKLTNWARDLQMQPVLDRLNDMRNHLLKQKHLFKTDKEVDKFMSNNRESYINQLIRDKIISPKLVSYLQKYFDDPKIVQEQKPISLPTRPETKKDTIIPKETVPWSYTSSNRSQKINISKKRKSPLIPPPRQFDDLNINLSNQNKFVPPPGHPEHDPLSDD